jgi:hypothetical protein
VEDWPAIAEFITGEHSLKIVPLVKPEKVLPSLHIKQGLLKICVKALGKSGGFLYLRSKFPHLNDAKFWTRDLFPRTNYENYVCKNFERNFDCPELAGATLSNGWFVAFWATTTIWTTCYRTSRGEDSGGH